MIKSDRGRRLGAFGEDPAAGVDPYWLEVPGLAEMARAAGVDVSQPPRGIHGVLLYYREREIPASWITGYNTNDPINPPNPEWKAPDGTPWSQLPSGAHFNLTVLDAAKSSVVYWVKDDPRPNGFWNPGQPGDPFSINRVFYRPSRQEWLKWTALGIIAVVGVAMGASIALGPAATAGTATTVSTGAGGATVAGGGAAGAGTIGTIAAGAGKAAIAIGTAVGTKKITEALAPSKPAAQPAGGGNAGPPLQAGLLGGGTGTMIAIGGGLLVALLLLGGRRR